MQRPDDGTFLRECQSYGFSVRVCLGRLFELRQPEIEYLHAGLRDQNVGRFQVAMRDQLFVGRFKRARQLNRVPERLIERQWTFDLRALDVFHHEIIRSDVVKRANVRMIQRRYRACFALEAFAELCRGGLDGDDAIQSRVACLPDLAHATRSQAGKDLVRSEFCARLYFHRTGCGDAPFYAIEAVPHLSGNAGCILMGMTFSARYFVIATLLCGALSCRTAAAQDISGRWSGVADTTDEGNTKRQEPQSFEVKTIDGKLTAVSIGKDGKPGAVLKIEQDGTKVNLYRFLDFEGGEHLRWKVELKDGKFVGTFSALHDDPKKWVYDRIGAITLSRVDSAAVN